MIASKFNLMETSISRTIKQQVGEGFLTYLNNYRINISKGLLEDSEYNIAQISTMVGFRSDITFNRVFKKINGISPGKYRTMKQMNLLK